MYDITQPLRLAVGSHSAGSGFGCAMNVISWENGDQTITDMPDCTHPALSQLVYRINDHGCFHTESVSVGTTFCNYGCWEGSGPNGDDVKCKGHEEFEEVLCSECSIKVLKVAHSTVGTNFRFKTKDDNFWSPRVFKWFAKGFEKVYKSVLPEAAWRQRDFEGEAYGKYYSQLANIEAFIVAPMDYEGSEGLDESIVRFETYVSAFKKVFADRIKKAGDVRMKRDLEAALKLMGTKLMMVPEDANQVEDCFAGAQVRTD